MPRFGSRPLPVVSAATTSITAITIGTIIAAVAVFDIHMLTNARSRPSRRQSPGGVPPPAAAWERDAPVEPAALDREREDEPAEEQDRRRSRRTAPPSSIDMMPASGKATSGRSAVTSMSTASVIHQIAIQTSIASVARPACGNGTILPRAVGELGRQGEVAGEREHRTGDEADAGDALLQGQSHALPSLA